MCTYFIHLCTSAHVCIFRCRTLRKQVYMHMYVHLGVCVDAHMKGCAHEYMSVCQCVCMCVYAHVYVTEHICVHECIHKHLWRVHIQMSVCAYAHVWVSLILAGVCTCVHLHACPCICECLHGPRAHACVARHACMCECICTCAFCLARTHARVGRYPWFCVCSCVYTPISALLHVYLCVLTYASICTYMEIHGRSFVYTSR